MSVLLFIMWLSLTISISAMVLHSIGREYGDFVAMGASTRISVFIATGTVVGILIGVTCWLVL